MENQTGKFSAFWADYKKLSAAEDKKQFSFAPELPIKSVEGFEVALQNYADAHKQELIMLEESMYPRFTLDGIEYEAYRESGFHSDIVRCVALHPEQLDTVFSPERKKLLMQMKHIIMPAVLTFFIALAALLMMNGKAAGPQAPGLALGAAVVVGLIGAWQQRQAEAAEKAQEPTDKTE